MSAAVREALARAATTALGGMNTVTPYYRQTTTPGTGFVRLDSVAVDESTLGFIQLWQVCVILHQDLATAEKQIDELLPRLQEALEDEGRVTAAQPVQLSLDGPTVPALIITVAREQE